MKYAWIEVQRARYPVGRLYRLARGLAQRFLRLAVGLRARFARHRGKYGRPRLAADLREAGFPVNPKRVRRKRSFDNICH